MYFILHSPLILAGVCEDWFEKTKLKPGKDCLIKCASANVDMDTFVCSSICDELCKSSKKEKFLFQLSDLYPGLTNEEKAFCTKEPVKMMEAYRLSWNAEKICGKLFPSSQTNDESDACRHYVWAALFYKEFGLEFSSKVLNAHEQDPKQPESEKAMDLANNRLGLLTAEQLVRDGKFNEENILSTFKENLKNGRLIILRKSQRSGK